MALAPPACGSLAAAPRDRGHCVARRRVAVRAGSAASALISRRSTLGRSGSSPCSRSPCSSSGCAPGDFEARATADTEDELAAYTVAFVSLLLVAAGTALVSPYSLVFVLPSLYTWLWLPQLGRTPDWVTDALFGAGLVGPVLALVVLAEQLDLGARAPLYAASLITTGVIPWGATLALTVWAAIAGLVGAVASGNYAPTEPSRGR